MEYSTELKEPREKTPRAKVRRVAAKVKETIQKARAKARENQMEAKVHHQRQTRQQFATTAVNPDTKSRNAANTPQTLLVGQPAKGPAATPRAKENCRLAKAKENRPKEKAKARKTPHAEEQLRGNVNQPKELPPLAAKPTAKERAMESTITMQTFAEIGKQQEHASTAMDADTYTRTLPPTKTVNQALPCRRREHGKGRRHRKQLRQPP